MGVGRGWTGDLITIWKKLSPLIQSIAIITPIGVYSNLSTCTIALQEIILVKNDRPFYLIQRYCYSNQREFHLHNWVRLRLRFDGWSSMLEAVGEERRGGKVKGRQR